MKALFLSLMCALCALGTHAEQPSEEPSTPIPFDTKFVCESQLKSGEKIQVTGFLVDGEGKFLAKEKGAKVDHIYINGKRMPTDEQYNQQPVNMYFRPSYPLGDKITSAFFGLKTMNDGTLDHLVIEYAGKNNPANLMYLYSWQGVKEADPNQIQHIAHGSQVNCRFTWL